MTSSKTVVGLALVAIVIAVSAFFGLSSSSLIGAASCSTDTTCFTKLAATQSLESDGTLSVLGNATITGTTAVTATTTLSDGLNLNNPGICINFYATSTATRVYMIASTTATIEGVDGVMMFGYGSCAF